MDDNLYIVYKYKVNIDVKYIYALPLVLFAIYRTLTIGQCKFDVVLNKGTTYCLIFALLGDEVTVKEAADTRITFVDIAYRQGVPKKIQLWDLCAITRTWEYLNKDTQQLADGFRRISECGPYGWLTIPNLDWIAHHMKLNVSLYVDQTWREFFDGDLDAPIQYRILRLGYFERIERLSNAGSSNGKSTTAML